MPAGPNDLTTVAAVQAYLGVPSETDQTLLQSLVTAASGLMQQWMNRTIAVESYSEQRDGTGGSRLITTAYPIVSVASVQVDDVIVPSGGNSYTSGFYNDQNSIILTGYSFCRGYGNVLISYQAGYSSTPYELAQACIELVAMKYNRRSRMGLASASLAGATTAYSASDLTPTVLAVLQNYKKVVPV